MKRFDLVIAACLIISTVNVAHSQFDQRLAIECGDVVEGELTVGEPIQGYSIDLNPGDQLRVTTDALGEGVRFSLNLTDPAGSALTGGFNEDINLTLGSTGSYIIEVSYGTGVYTLSVSCTLRDGTVIEPGASAPANVVPGVPAPTFPNLAPTSLLSEPELPLVDDVAISGVLTPGSSTAFGFTFDAAANETINLQFARVSGNLNVGIVVLSPDGQVVGYGGLIAGGITLQITAPSDGAYRVQAFEVAVTPPAAPEATAFTVMLTRGG